MINDGEVAGHGKYASLSLPESNEKGKSLMVFDAIDVESSNDEPNCEALTPFPDPSLGPQDKTLAAVKCVDPVSDSALLPLPLPLANDYIISPVSLRVIYVYPEDLFAGKDNDGVDALLPEEDDLFDLDDTFSGFEDDTFIIDGNRKKMMLWLMAIFHNLKTLFIL